MVAYTTTLPIFDRADVVVLGAGSAGCTAAIAAARTGADTLLVERYGFLGGTSTMVLDTFYGFYIPGNDAQRVVGGLPWEIVERLRARGMIIERPSSYGAGQAVTYDPPTLQVVWEQTALEAGVRLRLHTFCVDVLKSDDGQIRGLVVAGKSGLGVIEGRVFIDSSGDADLCFRAGAPFQPAGEDGPAQSLTTTFRIANVDQDRAEKVKRADLTAMMREANQDGSFHLPREEGSVHRTPLSGVVATNMTRVAYVDGTDPAVLTNAEVDGRSQAIEYARFLRERVPGYEHSFLINFSTQIGIRETRRVYGEYRLTREDVLSAQSFDDAIARCGAPIEDHHPGSDTRWEYVPSGRTYDIPLRCLLPRELTNVLIAGRCLSATHDAHASVRSMGQCMAMGQAVGTVAGLAVNGAVAPRDLPVDQIQARLRADGALI
ncbi:MAG: FAD-dependent oxidoreductase [Roseiflexaceae bacterium]|nr:FAD-dependent oxidoreductase [Roseiflexaceae bacterium]